MDHETQHSPKTPVGTADPVPFPSLSNRLILMMAGATGLAVANIYYNQPMLAAMAETFGLSAGTIGLVPTVTQLGYAVGLLLIAPLGDKLERRGLISVMAVILIAALLLAALTPSFTVLLVASFMIGVFSTIAQQLVPMAAHLATPERRGAVIGTVMAGLLIGVLGARILSGLVASYAGWQAMYGLAALLMVIMAWMVRTALPVVPPASTLTYLHLMRSLVTLWRCEPVLRQASIIGSLLFGAFSAFWGNLALHLAGPAFGLGADSAGLFGVVGIAGALVAPVIGRLADQQGPDPLVRLGILLVLSGFFVFGLSTHSLVGLMIGVLLLDIGVQVAMIANQARIYALRPEARSRINTVYMVSYFVGGALGSALGAVCYGTAGWPGIAAYGITLAALALLVHSRPHRRGC